MKLPDQGAGSRLRRRLVKAVTAGLAFALCGSLLSGCMQATQKSPLSAGGTGVLTPLQTLPGARLQLKTGPAGMPVPEIGSGSFTFFVFPVAVAASPFEMYIADAGAGRLYHYDPMLDAMSVVPGVVVTLQTRLALGPDASVYVASPGRSPARRYDRTGRLLQEIDPGLGAARYDEMAIDRVSGMIYGLDRVFGRVEEVHPLGRSATLLAAELLPESPLAIAWDDHRLYLAGEHCGCVVAISLLQRTRTMIAQGFRRPSAIAASDGWLAVLDTGERKLSLFYHGQLRGEATAESLRLVDPQGIALSGGVLYVADATGRRLAVFRMNK